MDVAPLKTHSVTYSTSSPVFDTVYNVFNNMLSHLNSNQRSNKMPWFADLLGVASDVVDSLSHKPFFRHWELSAQLLAVLDEMSIHKQHTTVFEFSRMTYFFTRLSLVEQQTVQVDQLPSGFELASPAFIVGKCDVLPLKETVTKAFIATMVAWHVLPYIMTRQDTKIVLPHPSKQYLQFVQWVAQTFLSQKPLNLTDLDCLFDPVLVSPESDMPSTKYMQHVPSERLARMLGADGLRRMYILWLFFVRKVPRKHLEQEARSIYVVFRAQNTAKSSANGTAIPLDKIQSWHDGVINGAGKPPCPGGTTTVTNKVVKGKHIMAVSKHTIKCIYEAVFKRTGKQRRKANPAHNNYSHSHPQFAPLKTAQVLQAITGSKGVLFAAFPVKYSSMIYCLIGDQWYAGVQCVQNISSQIGLARQRSAAVQVTVPFSGDSGKNFELLIPGLHRMRFCDFEYVINLGLLCTPGWKDVLEFMGFQPVFDGSNNALNSTRAIDFATKGSCGGVNHIYDPDVFDDSSNEKAVLQHP